MLKLDHRMSSVIVLCALAACGQDPSDSARSNADPAGDQTTGVSAQPAPASLVAVCIAGDWDGDRFDQPGTVRPDDRGSLEWLLPGRTPGEHEVTAFGLAGDAPVRGDFDGDGVDGIGVFRKGKWFLKNTSAPGEADIELTFGIPGDLPVVGDYDGDGIDTVGVFRAGVWYLRNSNTTGEADLEIGYGVNGDDPLVGDFEGDGIDTIGVFRSGRFMLRNSNTQGGPDIEASFGFADELPLVGDWDGDGTDTIAVTRDGKLMARHTNSEGDAELIVPCSPEQ